MSSSKQYTGFAIAIAWPETFCKQPGAWYDKLALQLHINKNNYYKVGHAALVLIDSQHQKAHYFDFGRYHAPYKHGRVRSAKTDHDLEINTIPQMNSDGQGLENFWNILFELQNNPACHGEGKLYASYCPINFKEAFAKANLMQTISPIAYGPFQYKGSNCSRFVNTTILAGKPNFRHWVNLKFRMWVTPTPMNNVNSLDNRIVLPKLLKNQAFYPYEKLDNQLLVSTLGKPNRHHKIPQNAQWLSGEGAGSWFACLFIDSILEVTRYSADGVIECVGSYLNVNAPEFSTINEGVITYPSNCMEVSVLYNDQKIRFERIIN